MFYLRQGKSIVETGELREKIQICERKTVIDRKTGVQKVVYETLIDTRAKIIGESGKAFLSADRENHQVRKRVFIRRRKGLEITEEHFIKYKNDIYKIIEHDYLDVMFYELKIQRTEQ